MKTKSIIIVIVFITSFFGCNAQNEKKTSDFPELKGPYLGQKPPGMVPEIFAPGIISTDEFEFGGTFSPDGETYFFTKRSEYEEDENRIFYSRLVNEKWSDPQIAPFTKDVFEFEPIISPDGQRLYFFF